METSFDLQIAKYMSEKGLNDTQLAKMVGLTKTMVGNWKKKINKPKLDTILQLCEIFNCTPNDLLLDEVENGYVVMEDGAKYGLNEVEQLRKEKEEIKEDFIEISKKYIDLLEKFK